MSFRRLKILLQIPKKIV